MALGSLFFFKGKTLFFCFKPFSIVALEWISFTAVHFKNPACYIVKEVAVMGDGDNSSLVVAQMTFKPCNCFCIKMVCRFVKKKNIRPLQKKAAKSNTAAFTTGKNVNNLVCRWTAEGIHGKFKVSIKVPCICGIKFFLKFGLACTKLIKVCIRITKGFVHLVKFLKKVCYWLYTFLYDFHYSLAWFKVWFLFKIAHCKPGKKLSFTCIICIASCKNFKKRRFTRTVFTDDTDLCAVIVGNAYVL